MRKSFTLSGSILLIAILISGAFAQTATVSKLKPENSKEVSKSVNNSKPVSMEKIESDVAEALTIIESNHVKGKRLDYNSLFKRAIDSMLHTLDPHSNYFDAKETEQFRTSQNSQYFGIGATIGDLSDEKGNVIATFIKATFDGAPAHRAGLRYGDKIVEVNGVSMLGKPYAEVREHLRGPRGTVAKLLVEKYSTGKRELVEIIRDAVPQPSISEAYMIKPQVGYIAMRGGFNYTTYQEFRESMKLLKAQGMEQLVIDLRDNGGGLVSQANEVANTFLENGQTIFTQKGRLDGSARISKAENESPEKMPIVVLVNKGTASASEILAGALQDHDRALIVGENTFGKGLVQNPFPLEYGSMLLLTIAKYETPSGRLIQRDYSDGNLYNYYYKGGSLYDENEPQTIKGDEKKTDAGRPVYGGSGISPDELIKAQTITSEKAKFQAKLIDPIFAYSLALAYGKVPGFETLKVDRPIEFNYDIKSTDFSVTDRVFDNFKQFAVEKYKFTPQQIDREREFINRTLRTELVTASYGVTTSYQVFNDYDNQLIRAIELLPQARQLAIRGAQAKIQNQKSKTNK